MGKHKGFTFIEVTLFAAVTAALFLGVALGMSNAITQQQYNDSVQSFLEYMRSVYSQVSNPQSMGAGNSNYAIYGKMVVFGETTDLLGNSITDGQQVFEYDLIGDASSKSPSDLKTLLKDLSIGVAFVRKDSFGRITSIDLAEPEKFEPRWQAGIETTTLGETMKKTIMVVRHPRAGTINTLVYNGVIQVNEIIKNARGSCISTMSCSMVTDMIKNLVDNFNTQQVDFCINPYGESATSGIPRQDIRLISNARNASGVQLIDLDDVNPDTGNKCL